MQNYAEYPHNAELEGARQRVTRMIKGLEKTL